MFSSSTFPRDRCASASSALETSNQPSNQRCFRARCAELQAVQPDRLFSPQQLARKLSSACNHLACPSRPPARSLSAKPKSSAVAVGHFLLCTFLFYFFSHFFSPVPFHLRLVQDVTGFTVFAAPVAYVNASFLSSFISLFHQHHQHHHNQHQPPSFSTPPSPSSPPVSNNKSLRDLTATGMFILSYSHLRAHAQTFPLSHFPTTAPHVMN